MSTSLFIFNLYCFIKVKIAKVQEDLSEIGKALPIFDSLGEVVDSTIHPPHSTEMRDTNATGSLDKESKVSS